MNKPQYDVLIIGAGAVGLSTAWKLLQKYPDMRLAVLDKEPQVASHQTGHNSGVIHSGIYYRPGSHKARNCIAGRQELVAFARTYDIPHDVCGKVIVATDPEEFDRLDGIYQTGLNNGLDDIRHLDEHEIRAHEPCCAGLRGIFVPYTGIIDYAAYCRKLQELIQAHQGSQVWLGQEVVRISRQDRVFTVSTPQDIFQARYLIACAGLHSDRIARLAGFQPVTRIVGFRGDYYNLSASGRKKVRHLIYPVPNPAFPFLGVHFTRMTDGETECGPSAVFTFKREGYGKTDFLWQDTREALGFRGTWKLFFRHWRFGINEQLRAFSKSRFLKAVQRLIPSLTRDELVPGRSGVRAMALKPDGQMVDDFVIETAPDTIHVLNAPSPAATACLAIGSDIVQTFENQLVRD